MLDQREKSSDLKETRQEQSQGALNLTTPPPVSMPKGGGAIRG
jgi:hypothetical protein